VTGELEERDIQLDVSTYIHLDVSISTWHLHLQSKSSRNRRIRGERYPARCKYTHLVLYLHLQSKSSRNRRIGGEIYPAKCKYLYPARCKYIHMVSTLAEQEFQKQENWRREISS
jgi:hypothetical protein